MANNEKPANLAIPHLDRQRWVPQNEEIRFAGKASLRSLFANTKWVS